MHHPRTPRQNETPTSLLLICFYSEHSERDPGREPLPRSHFLSSAATSRGGIASKILSEPAVRFCCFFLQVEGMLEVKLKQCSTGCVFLVVFQRIPSCNCRTASSTLSTFNVHLAKAARLAAKAAAPMPAPS